MEDTVKHILSKTNDSDLTNVQEGDSQPNAVDLRVSKIFKMDGQFLISEDKKVHRSTEEIIPDEKDWWSLDTGVYEIVMENIVSVGEGYAGFVITRSTLNRNGVFITSGF